MKKGIIILVFMIGISLNVLAQQVVVTGTVTDENNEPLIGANVIVKDFVGLGTATDLKGTYKLKMEPYHTLIFSFLGYENVEVFVKDKHVINIKMKEIKSNALNEVVVNGMGTQKRVSVTGAVTTVNVEDLKQYPTSSLSNALIGNVPGILAMETSGQPGKNTSEFWVRGIATFGASSSALIMVDGFERDNIDDININDIESFTVLKDAAATAIYGSKGANGVILITTKHGKAGKVNISAQVETSYNTRTITPKFVDGYTYAKLANEACTTRDIGAIYQPVELELIKDGLDPDFYPNVDWSKLILKNGAGSYRANLNINGGGSTARYYVSVAYTEDQGMYKTDDTLKKDYNTNANYKRWNYRMNVDVDVTKTTRLEFGLAGWLDKRNSPGLGDDNEWGELFGYNAVATPVVYSNGYIPMRWRNVNQMNPWIAATQTGYNENWDNSIQTNMQLEQNLGFITNGLNFTGRFGYDTNNYNNIYRRQWPDMYKANGRDATGNIIWDHVYTAQPMTQSSDNSGDRREFVDLLLNYNRSFLKVHNTDVTLRYTQDSKVQTENIGSDIKNGVSRRNQGLAGRFTYNYNMRYFFDFNFGYTGSENFAKGHRFGFFPAYSVAWNLTGEKFISNNFKWIDMFKIRYSHGKVGNDNLGDSNRFPYLSTISEGGSGYNFGSSATPNSFNGAYYSQVSSPYVTWEISTKDDAGIDLSLFHDNLSATIDYFHEKRTGIYMVRNYLPAITGLESNPSANVGAVSSKGFDGNFTFKKRIDQVDLTVRGNITYSKNEVLNEDEENEVYSYQYKRGYRVNQQKGLISLGLFKDYDDIRNSPKQQFGTVQPGDIKYKDVNGDGIIDGNDVVAIGSTSTPNLAYGLGASLSWKGFDFNIHFQGVGKCTFPIYGKCVYAFSESNWGNIFNGMLDNRWISADISGNPATENPNASYPRLSYGGDNNNQQTSSYWLRDGRYLRLKNLDIGYTLPKAITERFHTNNIRIYVTGTNLITWAKFKYWDPETADSRGETYPLAKTITMGLTFNL